MGSSDSSTVIETDTGASVSMVGSGVGSGVGSFEGLRVGSDVGSGVGSLLGFRVGYSVGISVGASVMGLHMVNAKQLSPFGHSLADPDGQGIVHFSLASPYETPQKNELRSPHGVLPKQPMPGGQSSLPFGQATPQS